jgi:hypothetical protein
MPLLVLLSLTFQVLCVVHIIRTGRDRIWIWVIVFFSLVGCAVYFAMEILPEFMHSRTGRKTIKAVMKKIDPERDLRELAKQVQISDNVENKTKLAGECAKEGLYDEAIELYRGSLKGIYADDPNILLKLAFVLFHKGDYQEVKSTLNTLIAANPNFKSSEGHLLFARTLEALKEYEQALDEYQVLSSYYPGEEAKCRYGLLLRNLGQTEKARELFKQIVTSTQLAPKFYQGKQKEWIEIASQHLH